MFKGGQAGPFYGGRAQYAQRMIDTYPRQTNAQLAALKALAIRAGHQRRGAEDHQLVVRTCRPGR